MSQRIGFLSFSQKKKKTTQRIELSPKIRYKELNFFFFQYDSKIFSNMTRRIEPFFITWLKDLVFFTKKKTQRIWLPMTHRLEPSFQNIFPKNDSKNWSLFFSLWLSKWNFFLKYEYESQSCIFSIRITELIFFFFLNMTFFFQNWIIFFFLNTTRRIEILQYDSEDSTFFSPIWLKELNLSCFPMWLNEFFAENRKKVQCIASSKKKAQFFESNNKRFNSLSPNSKKKKNSSILRVMWRKVQFWRKKSIFCLFFNPNFNWVTFKKMGSIHWVVFKKKKNQSSILLSHTQKEVQFFESYFWKKSILWVIFKKKKRR